jgi:hypothetical protein
MESDEALVVTRTASLTTTDMISNVGGALGLFCGFSILSGIEAFYWLCRRGGRTKSSRRKVANSVAKKATTDTSDSKV